MKKRTVWICALIAFAVISAIIVSLFYINSYDSALKKAGLNPHAVTILDVGIDDNGNEYRVVMQHTDDRDVQFAHLCRENAGLWTVCQVPLDVEDELLEMKWMRVAGMKRFSLQDNYVVQWETHAVYGGNNAIKRIDLPSELLPPNVTLSIHQAGASYVLHFIYFGEDNTTFNDFDVEALLLQTNSIESKD